MAKVMETISGAIGKVYDLKELDNGSAVMRISVATTPRYMKDNQWVDGETIWTNVTLWNSLARSFARSNLQPGTPVIITGTRKARLNQSYTNRNGVEVPEHVEQEVVADSVAVELMPYNVVTSQSTGKGGNHNHQAQRQSAPAQRQSAPQNNYRQSNTPAQNQNTAPKSPVQTQQNDFEADPFANNPVNTDSNEVDEEDIFKDL